MSRIYKPKKRTYTSGYEFRCKHHDNCDNCPLPACVMDGYDPTREQRRFNSPSFVWTPDLAEKYHPANCNLILQV